MFRAKSRGKKKSSNAIQKIGQQSDEEVRILNIARRNFKLALLSTGSTLIALFVASFVNLQIPKSESPEAEYTYYMKVSTNLFVLHLFCFVLFYPYRRYPNLFNTNRPNYS